MLSLPTVRLVPLLLAILALTAHAQAGIGLPGRAWNGDQSSSAITWDYDTGSTCTILCNAAADEIGLDPDESDDLVPIGDEWYYCYENIQVQCEDSYGHTCFGLTTVYVLEVREGGSGSTENLLGNDIRRAFEGLWDDETERVLWRNTTPDIFVAVTASAATDSTSGAQKWVQDVQLTHGATSLAMQAAFTSGCNLSFIPRSVADALGAEPLGTVNLLSYDLESLLSMTRGLQNVSGQFLFDVVLIDGIDLGVGPAVDGPVLMFVSEDANSDFGVLGTDIVDSSGPGGFLFYESEDVPHNLFFHVGPHGTGTTTTRGL